MRLITFTIVLCRSVNVVHSASEFLYYKTVTNKDKIFVARHRFKGQVDRVWPKSTLNMLIKSRHATIFNRNGNVFPI